MNSGGSRRVGKAGGCIMVEVAQGQGKGEGADEARGSDDRVAQRAKIGGNEKGVGHRMRPRCRYCRMIVKKKGKRNRTEKGRKWGVARKTRKGAKAGEKG